MNIRTYLQNGGFLLLDGGMGTLLQAEGLAPGEHPELWNLTRPEIIQGIHKAYFDAGSNVVNTNTFGANCLTFDSSTLEKVITAAVKNAREAAEASQGVQEKFVALDMGPLGQLLKPYGTLDFQDAVAVFAQTVRLGVAAGVDLVTVETMNDSLETKAALLAVKENCDLPVFVTNAYGADGKLMTGASPEAMVALLEGMGADAIGVNCSLGPKQLAGVVDRILEVASLPVIVKPNAGLPEERDGVTTFNVLPDEFAADVSAMAERGVRIMGGCCGTTPAYIKALSQSLEGKTPLPVTEKDITTVSSYTHAVTFGKRPLLIGERINPTGKKKLKEALRACDMTYILSEGQGQADAGVDILDVNVGLPDIDEASMLTRVMEELQAVCDLPLQLDTADPVAMERALRRYNGKALVNSVNGKAESMAAVFPLVKKYGGVVIALTLDERGIPATAEERLAIARRILTVAESYGISKKNVVFDPLAMTVSADPSAARETLKALTLIREELGCYTSLGVSNVSFGLPTRDIINGTFFAMALGSGLSAAIMNPHSADMRRAYIAYCALMGLDENFTDYMTYAESLPVTSAQGGTTAPAPAVRMKSAAEGCSPLQAAIIRGLSEQAKTLTAEMLTAQPPLVVINEQIIPALDVVGKGFESGKMFLPQLLMSASAASGAFEVIKSSASADSSAQGGRFTVVLATVKGDVHDIGKNIVKLLLENYGYTVIDMGRDVPPEDILAKVLETGAPVAALSALMTTTVPAMAETIALIHEKAPFCRVIVGGAVLNPEYAQRIGADAYGKDAMECVRYCETL